MRTFVAVELDQRQRLALKQVIQSLSRVAGGVRWVNPASVHLTLKFIGELAEADLPRAISCLEEAARHCQPFSMAVGGLSAFPPRGRPRVIHLSVQEATGALAALHKEVEQRLNESLGVPREGRPFAPHLTLGRVKEGQACPNIEELAAQIAVPEIGVVQVNDFVLMKSDLRPTGPVYTELHRFPLG